MSVLDSLACRRGIAVAAVVAGTLFSSSILLAAPTADGPAATDGGAPLADGGATEREARQLVATARAIGALIAGDLDPAIEPERLFDVELRDAAGLRVEAVRLRAIIRTADEESDKPPAAQRARRPRAIRPAPSAAADGGDIAAPASLLAARVELDRARLAFYELPDARRAQILAAHAERRRAAGSSSPELTAAERRAEEAEDERRKALEAAAHAKTEAERLVAQEHAKLLDIAKQQAVFEAGLTTARDRMKAHSERTLAFERRVGELVDAGGAGGPSGDALYDELRTWLRASRDELDAALSSSSVRASAVPEPGEDALGNLPSGVNRGEYEQARHRALATATRLSATDAALDAERLKQLAEEVRELNDERLRLLPLLSDAKARRVTGMGLDGLDQATAELRQVSLILRYHLHEARRWATELWRGRAPRGTSMTVAFVGAQWLLVLSAFAWWRRRAEAFLQDAVARVRERDRRQRTMEPSRLVAVLGFALRIRRPLEWLACSWAILSLLPESTAQLVEIHLARTAVLWTFGGAFAVATIDALAGGAAEETDRADRMATAELRLRSLRLVGRTVVVFGLILSLSAQLVGRGTIHAWVLSTCWFAAVPVGMLVVRWWREEIFLRIERTRKKTAVDRWIQSNHRGWKSSLAATAGGVVLFASGAARAARNWVGRFDLTRRALAYLFRRGLDRLAEENETANLSPLPEPTLSITGPDEPSSEALTTPASEELDRLMTAIGTAHGGVFALVGERGSGKTTALRLWKAGRSDIVYLDCPYGGFPALEAALVAGAGSSDGKDFDTASAFLDTRGRASALLIDNAHRLIHPVMGGLAALDRLAAAARAHSRSCTWVFAMDEVVWRFFERARGARPLFDDVVLLKPWREDEIATLIEARSRQASISPSYRHVLPRLPLDADEEDLAEVTRRTAVGYHRLLWDYSAGNAGVALHLWRNSLGVAPDGEICVKPFQAPDTTDLEQLPDPAVFVLRAIVQLEEALPEDIVSATMLPAGAVADTLRYGLSRGYLERVGERYRVTWTWFRALTRFLRRRHLLARQVD